jgi:D-3-phosphoglycerate dehydrogenase
MQDTRIAPHRFNAIAVAFGAARLAVTAREPVKGREGAMADTQRHLRVLVADSISDQGVELLRRTPGFEVDVKTGMSPEEAARTVGDYHALIVRSATRVTQQVLVRPGHLQVIGRAGTGVDNIDLDAATRAGIVVMNTPGGNSVAAAELTMALLLAMCRNVPQANAEMRQGKWERKAWMGVELAGKTLGIVGLGRIGREVAARAQRFRMTVIGYDPYVSSDVAEGHGIQFQPLTELISQADVVSLHLPLTEETRHLINRDVIQQMKTGARIINCARGGLVDEDALLEGIQSGHLGGAALDVFESEPPKNRALVEDPRVVSTPHLGASTREAQERVGTEIAEKVRDYLQKGVILDAVNFPSVGSQEYAALGPLMGLAERLGRFLGQVLEGGFKRFSVHTLGTFSQHALKPVVMAATRGLLSPVLEGSVSYVNALSLAGERGIRVDEGRSSNPSPYAGLLRLTLETDKGSATVAGTLFEPGQPRLVEVDGVPIEARPEGTMLFFRNRDVPGVVGKIGSYLGEASVNIAGLQLGRPERGGIAVSIINVDNPVPPATLEKIRAMDEIVHARTIKV